MEFYQVWIFFVTCICSAQSVKMHKVFSTDVCDDEQFQAECPSQQVLVIQEALYGHIGLSRCTPLNTGHFGCSTSVLELLTARCTGKQRCQLDEVDRELKDVQPCKGLLVYLHVKYICIAARPIDPCQPITVDVSPSYVTSTQASGTSCRKDSVGGLQLSLTAPLGQTIHVSAISLQSTALRPSPRDVGYILDESNDQVQPLTLAGQMGEEVEVYVSRSHKVTLALQASDQQHFLVILQGRGCEDLPQPRDMWLERRGMVTTVGCINTNRQWSLQCKGVLWAGVIGNCTEEPQLQVEALHQVTDAPLALPKEVILVLIVGLTVVLALVIITTGYVIYKRKYQLPPVESAYDYEITYNNFRRAPTQPGTLDRQATLVRAGPVVSTTLLRPTPATATLSRSGGQGEAHNVHIWEQSLPLPPPPRRDSYHGYSGTVRSVRGTRNVGVEQNDVTGAETLLLSPEENV